MGGSACIDFALEHPNMVTALVPVCSAPSGMPYGDEGELPPIIQELIAADQAGDLDRMNDLEVRLWVDGLYRSPEQVDAKVRERVSEMNRIALHNAALGTGAEQPLDPPAVNRLGEIIVPTLVIVGEVDVPTTHHAAQLMMEHVSPAQQAIIENTAHLPNMERPDEFNRIVLDFLRAL
jgi:pimeloyl-ACP methyl ester carboxylesterase